MFPLVHYAVNEKIYGKVSPLMAIGGLWPDMAIGARVPREDGHTRCKEFYAWCKKNAPEQLDLAIGALTHSTEPGCVDYYADEYYPVELDCPAKPQPDMARVFPRFVSEKYRHEYPKGWCFVGGEPYLDEVSAATHLPDGLIWWKGHNFIEMGYEVLTDEQHPEIKGRILEAVHNTVAINTASELLAEFYGASAARIRLIYSRVPILFALQDASPYAMARKQCRLFVIRFSHGNAEPEKMARLIERISDDMRSNYPYLMNFMARQAAAVVAECDHSCLALPAASKTCFTHPLVTPVC